jgi:hypothetical protein
VVGVEEEERKNKKRGGRSRAEALPRLLVVTIGRRSTGRGSAGCAGRTRPPLVGVRSGPRSCRRSSSGSASTMSRRSPPCRGERPRRSAAEATRRWRVHPTVSAHTGEGLGRRLRLALSTAARRPLVSLAAAHERERGRGRMRLGFARGRRARFCSAGNLAQPSNLDGRLTLTGPSFSPGGMKLSRPRPRLRPGARDVPSVSGPLG